MIRNCRAYTGQHFLCSADAVDRVVQAAKISATDNVLEVGTGTGALVEKLCEHASSVLSIERDAELHRKALARFTIPNLRLVCGDGFAAGIECDVFVSSLPYSQSRRAFEWMAQQKFMRGALVVQKEFAEKLSPQELKKRRAISVIAHAAFEIEHIANVGRTSFAPPPRVDSVIIALKRRSTLDAQTIRSINALFSYRRKTLRGALERLGAKTTGPITQRLETLDGDEIVKIAKTL